VAVEQREPATNHELIRVDNLHTQFFTEQGVVKAVDGVSFGIEKGKVLGVVGESGCGKSVTAMSIMRFYQNQGGGSSLARSRSTHRRGALWISPVWIAIAQRCAASEAAT